MEMILLERGAREFREEIGLNINPLDLKVVHIMHRKAEKDERIDFLFFTQNGVGNKMMEVRLPFIFK